jgi:hypothetical protein
MLTLIPSTFSFYSPTFYFYFNSQLNCWFPFKFPLFFCPLLSSISFGSFSLFIIHLFNFLFLLCIAMIFDFFWIAIILNQKLCHGFGIYAFIVIIFIYLWMSFMSLYYSLHLELIKNYFLNEIFAQILVS